MDMHKLFLSNVFSPVFHRDCDVRRSHNIRLPVDEVYRTQTFYVPIIDCLQDFWRSREVISS